MGKPHVRDVGIITKAIERLFFGLQYLPPQLFVEKRVPHKERLWLITDPKERERESYKRMICTETIIIFYIVIYVLAIIFQKIIAQHNCLANTFIVLVALRLIDIIQANVNISIFDELRITRTNPEGNNLYSLARSIVLVLLNFIEVAVIFGLFYSFIGYGSLNSTDDLTFADKMYFSFITQLTIGYGDITPKGIFKVLTCVQGLIGYFFTIIIIARLLSSLPQIKSANK